MYFHETFLHYKGNFLVVKLEISDFMSVTGPEVILYSLDSNSQPWVQKETNTFPISANIPFVSLPPAFFSSSSSSLPTPPGR